MSRRDTVGTTYLIHFDRKYRHAGHYVGWALDLEQRIADHRNSKGSRLLAVVNEAGIGWEVVRTWPGTTREFERSIKATRHTPHYCPIEQVQRSAARRQARAQRKAQEAAMEKNNVAAIRPVRPVVEALTPHEAAQLVRELDHGHQQSKDAHGARDELSRELDELAQEEYDTALSIRQREVDEDIPQWLARTRADEPGPNQTTLGEMITDLNAGTVTRAQLKDAIKDVIHIHDGAIVARPEISSEREHMNENFEQQASSDYGMAMGQPPGGQAPSDPRYALGDHASELTGDLAQARDAHARAEIDKAAEDFRARQPEIEHEADYDDYEMG